MSVPLDWTVEETDARAIVRMRGDLDLRTTPHLRKVLLKCLAEQPDALLVDLSAMELSDDSALSVFTAVAGQAATWPGIPVLLCAPRPRTEELLRRGRYGSLQVHPTIAAALRAVTEGQMVTPSISDQLLPVSGAVRHARNMATEACSKFHLPELVGEACLVVSELVSNGIEHAGTLMTLRIARRARYVHIALRDGCPDEPRLTRPAADGALRGRGLMLVDSIAVHWGWLPSRDGKVVWATLAAGPKSNTH